MGSFSIWHWVVVLLVVLLLFGSGKISGLMGDLAKGIKSFKQNIKEDEKDASMAAESAPPAPGTCAHDDFLDSRGSANIDNQYYRVVGCTRGFLPGGLGERLDSEMLEGSWTIVIAVKGVENLRNDPNVEVSISAGADPIQLSPTGKALPYATYVMDADQKFRVTTKGRIVNGILYSNPVNVRFHFSANGKRFERSLNAGRLRLHLHSAADAESYLSGYTSDRKSVV